MSNITKDTSINELLTTIMAEEIKEALDKNNAADQLNGTEFKMSLDVSGKQYSYVLKDGASVEVIEGNLDEKMILLKISEDDLQKMIATQELDMIMGITTKIDKVKYDTIKKLKGSFQAVLKNNDDSTYKIDVVFNDTDSPNCTFKMKTADSAALMRKEQNPVSLFISGAMQIEGDMPFAMSTQPLFS